MATELVSSDYRVWWLASDCETCIAGITDAGVLETLGGYNIDIDFSTGKAFTVDINASLASDAYIYGIDVDVQQTAEYTGGTAIESGGIIGVRSDVHVDYQITEAYAGYFNVYIDPASSESINDMLGVFGRIVMQGTLTQALTTSQVAALRGSISNSCSGSYDGQVFALSLDYGSNVNYGDTTALIYMWTHGDARCDYGFYLNNYSPNMTAGIYLSETSGSSPAMTTAISIDATCTTGISVAPTVTASSVTGLSIAPTVTGQCSGTLYGFNVDFDWSGGDINAYGGKIDVAQTDETSGTPALGSRGNIQAFRSSAHATETIDDCYAIRGDCYVNFAANDEINDAVGVFANLQINGADVDRAAATSSMCALKGNVSNSSSGAYDGQVYGLMLSYGSNVDYGDTTALIFGYTHADARADYGIYILNYSPYMTKGLCLTEQNTSASMNVGIDIDVNGIGADTNYYGIDLDVTQQAISGGGYLSRGNLQGIRSDCNATGNIDHVYAVRGVASLAMAGDTETNQFYTGIFNTGASGAHTLTLHDGLVGIQATVSVDSGVTDVTGGLVAAAFFNSQPIGKNVTSPTYSIYVKAGGYTDFGESIQVESNNLTAAMRIQTTDSAVCPIGLQLNSASGSITKQIELSSGAGFYTGTADPNGTLSAEDGSIYLRTGTSNANSILYVCTGTTNWTANTC